MTIQIVNNGAPSGNDKLVVVNSASACGGAFHFGTVDLGSPNYVTANARLHELEDRVEPQRDADVHARRLGDDDGA